MGTLILAVVFALMIALFAIQNHAAVTVRLFAWEYETSLALLILGAVSLGAVLTFFASLGPRIRRAREVRRLEATVLSQGEHIRELEKAEPQSPAQGA